ncbi:MAG: amidohydrolase family protein [Balneolaceae bacterium]
MSDSEILYQEIDKIDAHIHHNVNRTAILDEAVSNGFQLVTINTDIPEFDSTEKQRLVALESGEYSPGMLNFIATFSSKGWGKPEWQENALEQIKTGWEKGAVAVKIWKNFGLELKDQNGNHIMADDPSLEPIYDYLEKHNIPLAAHLGEPKNCWLPIDKMTVSSDKDYFSKNPRYHMYLQKDFPPYEEQLQARDRVLNNHPDLRFIGLHLASLEWSIEKLANWLDNYPNAGVDLAERVCHLQFQSIDNHKKVKEFLERYQDRIIYGSDQIDDGSADTDEIQDSIRTRWHNEFQFFADDSIQKAWNVEKPFKGMGLDKKILKKIFHDNALKYYYRLKKTD